MKCSNCGGEWSAGADSVHQMKHCPFCGQSLARAPEKDAGQLNSMEAVLHHIYSQFGMEPFHNRKSLLGLHLDLAPDRSRDRRLIEHFMLCGGHTFLEATLKKSKAEQPAALVRLVRGMYEEWFIREDAAREICIVWWKLLGGSPDALNQLLQTADKTAPAPDPGSVSGSVPETRKPAPKPVPDPDPDPVTFVQAPVPAGAVCRPQDYIISGTLLMKYNGQATNIRIPDGVTKIKAWVFGGVLWGKPVESVWFPPGMRVIDEYAFCECKKLRDVFFPDRLQTIAQKAFSGNKTLREIIFPESLHTIGEGAFWECKALKEVRIPGKVSQISKNAFWNCTALEHVVLCHGVRSIEEGAFEWCAALKTIAIPDTVTAIHPRAFHGCNGVTVLASESWKQAHPDLYALIAG